MNTNMTGETPTDPIKPKLRIIEAAGDNNNKKKFQFLSAETTPGIFFWQLPTVTLTNNLRLDYRSKDAQDEKSKKTSTNESTKLQQRKDIFKDMNGKNPILTEQEVSRTFWVIKRFNQKQTVASRLPDSVRRNA